MKKQQIVLCENISIHQYDNIVCSIQLTHHNMRYTQSHITEHSPKIEKLIAIDEPNLETHVKNRIVERLMEDVQFLLEKKKKEVEKRQKIQRVQEQIQKKRQQKLRTIQSRNNQSALVMQKKKELQNKKIKLQQDYFNQIQDKIDKKQKDNIHNALLRQQQLQKQLQSSHVKSHKNGIINATYDTSVQINRYSDEPRFQQLSYQIKQKTLKAERNFENYKKNIINKMRQKSQAIPSIQERAFSLSMDGNSQKIKNWRKKVQNIQAAQQIAKSGRQKTINERRQSIKHKIDRWTQNMQTLTNREQQKYQQIKAKLDRKVSPKQWKDQRLQKYMKLWQDNSKHIQQQKKQQANRILEKHVQITEQNRLYKSKRDKIIQQIKHI